MTHKQFLKHDKPTRVDITLERGIIVGKRLQYEEFLKLFRVGSFYVELTFAEDQSEVFSIYSSDSDEILEPYLKAIDISELLD